MNNRMKQTDLFYILIKSESPELICIFSSFFFKIILWDIFCFCLLQGGAANRPSSVLWLRSWSSSWPSFPPAIRQGLGPSRGPGRRSALLTHCLRAWFLLLKYRMSFFLIAWFLRAIKEEDEQKGGKVPRSNRTEWGNLSSLVIRTVLFHRVRWLCAETVFKPRVFYTRLHPLTRRTQSHASVLRCHCCVNLPTCFLAGKDTWRGPNFKKSGQEAANGRASLKGQGQSSL